MTSPMIGPRHGETVPLRLRLVGAVALMGAVVLLRLPFWLLLVVLRWSGRMRLRPVTVRQTRLLFAAVQDAGRFYPGRVACLEVSVATRIAGALIGCPPDWCIGARFRPLIYHTWVEVDGEPIDELPSEEWPYQAALKL